MDDLGNGQVHEAEVVLCSGHVEMCFAREWKEDTPRHVRLIAGRATPVKRGTNRSGRERA
jgi:hypothetical protein